MEKNESNLCWRASGVLLVLVVGEKLISIFTSAEREMDSPEVELAKIFGANISRSST